MPPEHGADAGARPLQASVAIDDVTGIKEQTLAAAACWRSQPFWVTVALLADLRS